MTAAMALLWSTVFEICSAYPVAICSVVVLSYLTSPFALVHLLPILLFKLPLSLARSALCTLAPSLFEKDVTDERVFITGAATGIGKLMAREFAQLGATVVLLDKDESALSEALVEVCATSAAHNGWTEAEAPVYGYATDLSKREETYAAMARAATAAGACTILINNAGVVTGRKLLACDDESIERSFAVNALAHFWTVRAALPAMLAADKGHIVTVASSAGLLGVPGLADYCASKFAAVGFDESVRLELRKLGAGGVRTTLVCPMYIDTGMFEGATTKFPRFAPLLRPQDAASAVVRAVRTHREVLLMPLSAHLTPLFKGLLPRDVCVEIADWFGVLDTMDDFRGRANAAEAARGVHGAPGARTPVAKAQAKRSMNIQPAGVARMDEAFPVGGGCAQRRPATQARMATSPHRKAP